MFISFTRTTHAKLYKKNDNLMFTQIAKHTTLKSNLQIYNKAQYTVLLE